MRWIEEEKHEINSRRSVRGENLFKFCAHRAFTGRITAALNVGRVLEQRQHALFAVLGKGMQVEELVVRRRRVDLEVAGMNHHAERRVNRQRHTIDQAMRHLNRVNGKRSDFKALIRLNLVQVGIIEQPCSSNLSST